MEGKMKVSKIGIRSIVLFLMVVMVVGVLPMGVHAKPTSQARWGVTTDSSAPTEWQEGTLAAAMNYANALTEGSAYIQLVENIDKVNHTAWPLTFSQGKSTFLDLNGKNINRGLTIKTNFGNVITVNGALTIVDSSMSTAGAITGGHIDASASGHGGGGVYVASTGSFTMLGGSITLNNSTVGGGGVQVEGNFLLQGGNITNNQSQGTNVGGGGVLVWGGTFDMRGGSIERNKAISWAGGVDNRLVNSSFSMTGGTITGNECGTAFVCGGVNIIGSASIGGTAVIKNNYPTGYPTMQYNVYLYGGAPISVSTPFTTGAEIGVTTIPLEPSNSVNITTPSNTDFSSYFFSDVERYSIQNSGTGNNQIVKLVYLTKPAAPAVKADDANNTITGLNLATMEYSLDGGTTWTQTANPDLTGNKSVKVRVKAQGATSASDSVILTFTANSIFAGGDGTESNPYQIKTAVQLNAVRNFLDANFILMNDVTLESEWTPIGDYTHQFTGSFDGQNFVIKNLYINKPTADWLGLFGRTSVSSAISNLGLSNVDIQGSWLVGGIAGENNGSITNCYSSGTIYGYAYIGGLVGKNGGTISISHASGTVTATSSSGGGLVGQNNEPASISDSYASGLVNGDSYLGGLVGENYKATISNSYSTADVEGVASTSYLGGLVGMFSGSIDNSYATGSVKGFGYSGGLIGEIYRDGTVTDSYAIGAVTGTDHLGGLIGSIYDKGTITNTYASGVVTVRTAGSGNNVGGLIGFNSNGVVSYSFWDTETTGQSQSAGGFGRSTQLMKQQGTFTNWDFTVDDVWSIKSGSEISYPYLQSNTQSPAPGLEVQPNIAYKVEHYQEKLGGGYVLKDTENLMGTTATSVTAGAKTYTGFSENKTHTDRVASGTIAADGSTILKLYYDRNSYTVTFLDADDNMIGTALTFKFGQDAVAPPVPPRLGYAFKEWDMSLKNISSNLTAKAIYVTRNDPSIDIVQNHPEVTFKADGLSDTVKFSEEERTENISIKLKITVLKDDEVPGPDKSILEKYVEDTLKENKPEWLILDVSLFKVVGEVETAITNTEEEISVKFILPENFRNSDFHLVRVHEGVLETLNYIYNKQTFEVSFNTDRFSTYGILAGSDDSQTLPNTGDDGTAAALFLLLGLGLLGFSKPILRKKSNS